MQSKRTIFITFILLLFFCLVQVTPAESSLWESDEGIRMGYIGSKGVKSASSGLCGSWNDVITKYNNYVIGQATWNDVISCYNQYTSPPTYVGKAVCLTCHSTLTPDVVNSYNLHGHGYKLSKVSGAAPTLPFSTVPTPPTGFAWSDITYVIGGYGWKARYIDTEGYILTDGYNGVNTQYNLADSHLGTSAGFVAYESSTTTRKPYDCGSCHTTGYSSTGHQDGLAGIVGTWTDPGITCEACHGPGSLHASSGNTADITIDRESSLCGSCHYRGSLTTIPASSSLIQHHEQYNEWLASPHNSSSPSTPGCNDCHSPHASTKYDSQATGTGVIKQCTDCHTDKTVGLGMQALNCKDCHMPYIVKSAANISYTNADGTPLKEGDIRAHIFKIDPDADPNTFFTADGSGVTLDGNGKVSLPVTYACQSCHRSGGSATAYTVNQLKGFASSIH